MASGSWWRQSHQHDDVDVDPYSLVGTYCLVHDGGIHSSSIKTVSVDTVRLVVVTGVMGGPILGGKRPRSGDVNGFKFDCQSPEAAPWGVLDCVARWHADQHTLPHNSTKEEANTIHDDNDDDDKSVDLLESVNDEVCVEEDGAGMNRSPIAEMTSSPLDPIQVGYARGWGVSAPLCVMCPTYIGTAIPVVAASVRYGAAVCSYQLVAVVVPMGHPLQRAMEARSPPLHTNLLHNFHFTSTPNMCTPNGAVSFNVTPSVVDGDDVKHEEGVATKGGGGEVVGEQYSWLEVTERLLMDVAHVLVLQARASQMVPVDHCGPHPWYTAMWEAATSVRDMVLGSIRQPPSTGGIMAPFSNTGGDSTTNDNHHHPPSTSSRPHVVFTVPSGRNDGAVRACNILLRNVLAPRILSYTDGLVYLHIVDDDDRDFKRPQPGVALVVHVQEEDEEDTTGIIPMQPTTSYRSVLSSSSTFADVAYWAVCYGKVPVSVSWGRREARHGDDGGVVVDGLHMLATHTPTLSMREGDYDDTMSNSHVSSFLVPCTEEEQYTYAHGWSTRTEVLGCLPLAPLLTYPEVLPLDDILLPASSTLQRPGILERTQATVSMSMGSIDTPPPAPSNTYTNTIKLGGMMLHMDDAVSEDDDDTVVRPPPGATNGRPASGGKGGLPSSAALAASLVFLDSCGGGGEPKMMWLDALSKGFISRVTRYISSSCGRSCMLKSGQPTSKLSSVLFPATTPLSPSLATSAPSPKVLILVGAQQHRMSPTPILEAVRDVFHPLGTLDGTNASSLLAHLPKWDSKGGVLLTSLDAIVGATSSTHGGGDVQGYMWEWVSAILHDTHPPHIDPAVGLLLRLCAASDGVAITSVLAYMAVRRYVANINSINILVVLNEQEWRLKYLCSGTGGTGRPLTSITYLWRPALDPLIAATVYRHLDLTDGASRPFDGGDIVALGDDNEAAIQDAIGGLDTTQYYLTLRQKITGGCFGLCTSTERWCMKALLETAMLGRSN